MLLLVLCLVLVQGTLQHPQNEGVPSHHGGIAPAEYQTSFSCAERVAGYYADIESGCQLYHLCDVDGRRFTHSCPNATLFQQRMMICDHWYMVNCNKSVHDYSANLLIGQRDKPFIGNDHVHHREPVKSFTVSHNPGTLQLPNWFPTNANLPERIPEDSDNTVPSPPPQVSSIHFRYTPPPSSADDDSSAYSPREATYRDVIANNENSGQSIPQTPTSSSENERVVTPVSRISEYQEKRPVYSQRNVRYRDFSSDHDNSRQSLPQTSTTRSEEQIVITPVPHIFQYQETKSASSQRDARYRDFNNDHDNSGQSTSRSKDQRPVTPVPHISQYQESRSAASQRDARYRNSNDNSRQSIPRTFTSKFEDQRVVTNTPVPNYSQYHETASERRLPDAYTNNPFFQSLINKVTPPSVDNVAQQQINPQQSVPKISQQNAPKTITRQQPAKLEDIANVRVSHFQTPSDTRKTKELPEPIYFHNRGIQNTLPSARDHKFSDSYSDNPFLQRATNTRSQEVPVIATARNAAPNSSGKKYNIGENEEDLDNIVELHILDPRQMFYIPESKNHEIEKRNSTVLFISVPMPFHNNSHGFMHFRNDVRSLEGTNPQCPRCHPAFLTPGKCQPCVIIR